ncbi:MAG: malto-oligosyltrehalose trehalohydrolase [Pseudomonadota bacterium]
MSFSNKQHANEHQDTVPKQNPGHGAFPNKDGTTQFSLWAPDAKKITLKLGNGKTYPLKKTESGWFNTMLEARPGTSYSYVVNDELCIPDPAARAQISDVHGHSCVVDQDYPWKTTSWQGRPWHEAIIYELHVGLLGGFAKVEEYLPQLVKLGITAIELMPIHEFPGTRNWGYDGVLLFAPESSYGTPAQLKSLIDTAHELGLMVILDVVYNHFGPDGNYLNEYAKAFFREDIKTPWGAAIDFRQQQVRDFFCENALMWVHDYRFDGLRLDAVHAIAEKDFLVELAERVRNSVPASRYVHLILENEDNSASLLTKGFNAQWNDDGHNVLHHLLTNEAESYYANFSQWPTAKLARCLSDGFIFQGEHTRRGHRRGEPSGHLSPTAFVLFLQNHDQVGNRAFGERLASLADPDTLKAAVALVLLSPMIPLLFMGEEWGSRQPFLFFTDHKEELAQAICAGRRNEFAEFTSFAEATDRDQIPDPNAASSFLNSIVDQSIHSAPEHQDWWNFYSGLLQLRRTELIPRLPGTHSRGVIILADRAISAAWQMGDGSMLRIYLNLSTAKVSARPSWDQKRVLFSYGLPKFEYEQDLLPSQSILVTLEEGG